MTVFVIRRIGQSILVVAVMATLVFLAVYAVGDPVDVLAAPDANQVERAEIAQRFGLDRPLLAQFGSFAWRALQGDLGRSFVYNAPALEVILQRLPATLELALTALLLAVLVGLPLGMLAGLHPRSLLGKGLMSGSILGFSLPNFWIGLMLILLFAVEWRLLPAGGRGATVTVLGVPLAALTLDGLRHLVLPALTLALYKAALVMRIAEAGTREVWSQDYIRFARAKGVSRRRIVGLHVLKNILIPVVTVLGLEFGSMIAFAVVTETVFAYPGMGKLLIDSVNRLDRPVIVAYLMLTVVVFAAINLVVDLVYAALDPRIRLAEAGA